VSRVTETKSNSRQTAFIDKEAFMTRLYFHCAGPNELLVDNQGADVLDLAEARRRALMLARSIVEHAYGVKDFSEWLVYVGDDEDEEVLLVSFMDAMPTLH
jgi:hypothetical protein